MYQRIFWTKLQWRWEKVSFSKVAPCHFWSTWIIKTRVGVRRSTSSWRDGQIKPVGVGGRSTCVLDNSKSQLTLSTMLNSKGIYQCISWIHFFHKGSYLSFKRIWLPFSYKTSLFSVNRCIISPPCLNGGTCTSTGNSSYMCGCPEGFYGFNCEKSNAPDMIERKTRNEKPLSMVSPRWPWTGSLYTLLQNGGEKIILSFAC